ncbi:hypothetical protein BLA29_005461 [Euroglyphus maynei]|uniref:Uncharacterized protein n=1 Tax=Euroglyphus maynei TaxID=6958 RepID=A0A1Y3BRX4_EURMA|nr:hypothetical protein BLA29_005461 [Euroglyphus maynei]
MAKITLISLSLLPLIIWVESASQFTANTFMQLANVNLVRSKPFGNCSFIVVTYDRILYKAQMSDREFDDHLVERKPFMFSNVQLLSDHYPKLSKLIESNDHQHSKKRGSVVTMLTDDYGHYSMAYWTTIHPPKFRMQLFNAVNRTRFHNDEAANPISDTNATIESTTNNTVFVSTDQKYTFLAITMDNEFSSEMNVISFSYKSHSNSFAIMHGRSYKFILNQNDSLQIFSQHINVNGTSVKPCLGEHIITGFVRDTTLFVITSDHTFQIDGVISKDDGHLNDCDEWNACPVQYESVDKFFNNSMYHESILMIILMIWPF